MTVCEARQTTRNNGALSRRSLFDCLGLNRSPLPRCSPRALAPYFFHALRRRASTRGERYREVLFNGRSVHLKAAVEGRRARVGCIEVLSLCFLSLSPLASTLAHGPAHSPLPCSSFCFSLSCDLATSIERSARLAFTRGAWEQSSVLSSSFQFFFLRR